MKKIEESGLSRGRESLLTAPRVEAIIRAIEGGNFIETAATLAGVSKSTYSTWKRRGENEIRRVDAFEGFDAQDIIDRYLVEMQDESVKRKLESFADPIFDQTEWPYAVFSTLLAQARARFVSATISDIRDIGTNATKPNFAALKWLLQVTQPDLYGDRKTVTHEGNRDAPVAIEMVSPEALLAKIKELQTKKGTE